MNAVGGQIALIVIGLAIMLGPAFCAGWFLNRRKRADRRRRRSPLTGDLLRAPGHTLREQLESLQQDTAFDIALLLAVPTLPFAFLFFQSVVTGKPVAGPLLGLSLAVVASVVAVQVRSLIRRSAQLDTIRLGLDAELAAGEELSQLLRQGAFVFHDFPADKFNIDHVVIAPQGVFAVETKGYSKPKRDQGQADATVTFDGQALRFPTWMTREPIEQAERQAEWLAKWLTSAVGEPVGVVPVIALPGWFVQRTGRGRVRVFSGRELGGLLKTRNTQPLQSQALTRVVHQVEQRCRSAAAKFKEMAAAV